MRVICPNGTETVQGYGAAPANW